MARAADAKRRGDGRPVRARVAFAAIGQEHAVHVGPPHNDGEAFRNTIYDALGRSSDDFARRELQRLGDTLKGKGDASPGQMQAHVNAALAAIDGPGKSARALAGRGFGTIISVPNEPIN